VKSERGVTQEDRPLHSSLFTLHSSILFVGIVTLGGFLRLSGLAVPSLWLDEILGYDLASATTHAPWWQWITGLEIEHGPLYFASELAGRLSPSPELSARVAPALFGIVTIVVAWMAARQLRVHGSGTAAVFALLLACSPLHVYYSREARPYALLMLMATGLLALLLRGSSIRLVAGVLLLAVLTHAGAAPLLMATALTAALAFLLEHDAARRRFYGLAAIAAAVATSAVPLLYRHQPGGSAASGFRFDPILFRQLMHSFSVSALDTSQTHRAALAVLLLAAIGAVSLMIRDRVQGAVAMGMALLPLTVSLVALWRLGHWYAVRYVITSLPAYLLLASAGVIALAEALANAVSALSPARMRWLRSEAAALIIGLIGAAFIVRDGWPAMRTEPYRKPPWRTFAATIWHHAHPRDVVLTSNDWSLVSLGFYLRGMPQRVRLISAGELVGRATDVVAHNDRVWIVTAGFHSRQDILDWSCSYPVILASPIESTRLHYAPGLRDFLLHRATPADERAFMARFPGPRFDLSFGPGEDLFMQSGWYGAEGANGDFTRWAGRTATLLIPAGETLDRRVDFRAMPISFPGAPPQVMSISINGAPLARIAISEGWNDYSIAAPRDRWLWGINTLSFAFSRAAAPSSMSSSPDPRILSVDFHQVTVRSAATSATTARTSVLPEMTTTFRVNALDRGGQPTYLDVDTPRGAAESRLHVTDRNRDAVTALLGRLGFDPSSTLPDLANDRVRLQDLALTVAYDSDCLSDLEFLRIAYATLLGRGIDSVGERYLLGVLRRNKNREMVVRSIVDSEEFRKQLQ
jgi:mannosyltransferase